MTRVVILGGGPAGLGAAHRLRELGRAEVVVLERGERVGGNAGSFDWNGHRLDFGSHRLHPACEPALLARIRDLMGDDLLDRPRHGRIRLLGRWVHFPLKPLDLLLHVHPAFALGTLRDLARKALPADPPDEAAETFASVLERGLGSTICRDFYFPYAWKMWGRAPEELSAIQARRRVSAGSFGKLVRKVLSSVPGLRPPGSGRFFYPRGGFGQISERFAQDAGRLGADVRFGHAVRAVGRRGAGWVVTADAGGAAHEFPADHVWSTIPVTLLCRMLSPEAPTEVLKAAASISYRAMVLIYLELPVDRFTEFDAHYFPGRDVRITRLSETKNYAARSVPEGRTVICAELPCSREDEVWSMAETDLGSLLSEDLANSGLPLPAEPLAVHVERLPQAYPIYPTGYEVAFETLDAHVESLPNLLSFGRQGLFAHDNTHHALHMGSCAAESLREDGTLDLKAWFRHRQSFRSHVVED